MRRLIYFVKDGSAVLGVVLLAGLCCLAPFACVYGCRVAWTAGGQP